ncbi:probable WRKY transcription factor 51 [Cucurbita maxima]|uniref:Probable WRKY transcription factor 51 n=1 Tax=Cucurbita maxima TaxID=3661 RepID=A0A6J1INQ9_CUCMA|nr:probable WRKY transcription factor 51 [Cucurbita maxima]
MAMNPLQNPSFFLDYHQFQDSSFSFMDLFDVSSYPLPNFGLEAETMASLSTEARTEAERGSMKATSIDNNSMQVEKRKKERGVGCNNRVAFRTKSVLEILDDGFKWRKYGKKSVKNTSHLRNYYKCLNGGCGVKKRVERDRDDSSYVITTYEGIHNHASPFFDMV